MPAKPREAPQSRTFSLLLFDSADACDFEACPCLSLSSELWLEDEYNVLYFVNSATQAKKKPSWLRRMKILEILSDYAE